MASSPGKSTRSKHSLSNHKYMSDSVWWYRTMCRSLLTLHGLATLESASIAYDSWLLISCFLLFCFLTRSCPRRGSGGDRGPSIWGKKEIMSHTEIIQCMSLPKWFCINWLRLAAMRAIWCFINFEGQSHKDSVHKPQHFKRKESRSRFEPRSLCLAVYQRAKCVRHTCRR